MILTFQGNIVLDQVPPPLSHHLSSLSCCQSGLLYTSVQNLSLTTERERVREKTGRYRERVDGRKNWPGRKNEKKEMKEGGREGDKKRING